MSLAKGKAEDMKDNFWKELLWLAVPTILGFALLYGLAFSNKQPETSSIQTEYNSTQTQSTSHVEPHLSDSIVGLDTLVNSERKADGEPLLKLNDKLNKSAQLKADDMVKRNYWSHDLPDGTPWYSFIQKVGYDYSTSGENEAKCFKDNVNIVKAWMDSPTHRENILSKDYEEFGFGATRRADGCLVVVNHFGRR